MCVHNSVPAVRKDILHIGHNFHSMAGSLYALWQVFSEKWSEIRSTYIKGIPTRNLCMYIII